MIDSKRSTTPLVSTVVVSFHGGKMLEECLSSLEKQDYTCHEVIVVDNGSGKHLQKTLSSRFRNCRWVNEPQNLGFAGGCNRGIAAAKGSLIALINDDAIADQAWISSMVDCMQNNPDAGAVAGMAIDGNNPDILDSLGVGVALDGMSRQLECGAPSSLHRDTASVLAFSGCSCMLRKTALETTGCFDERFFAYCEDTDLSLRMLKAGWRIITCPAGKITHFYSQTGGRYSLKKMYLIERNHHWVALKNFPFPVLLALPLTNIWRILIQLYGLISGRGPARGFAGNGFIPAVKMLLKADFDMLTAVPAILRDRFTRQNSSTLSASFTAVLLKNRMSIPAIFLSGSETP
jgi:GT2 family glycosyltransferase